jgi:thiol-disulfide isomerase/thioredoxin
MRINRSLLIASFVAILVLAFAGTALYFFMQSTAEESITRDSGLVLLSYEGEKVKLSEFKQKAVVVHSWASWCPYCSDELRHLSDIKEIFGDSVAVVAINRAEPRIVAKEFSDGLGLPEGIVYLLDPDDAFYKQIEGYAMPETIIIDERGDTVYHQRGPITFKEIVDKINSLPLQ